MEPQDSKIGKSLFLTGCFTEEFFLRGLNVRQIGKALGLPEYRLANGLYIAWAVQLPSFHEFKLGGWAEFPTSEFYDYTKKRDKWSEEKFEKTYEGKRVPITIEQAKYAWLENMKHEKLIKVLLNIPGQDGDKYPAGEQASQIIVVHPIRCQIMKFIDGNDVFKGIW